MDFNLYFVIPTLCSALCLITAGSILPGAAEVENRGQKVWAREGSSALLPCYLSPRKHGKGRKQLSERTSVLWKRHGASAPQDLHVVLEVEYSGLRKTALPMRPRVSVLDSALRNGNFSLCINPVRSDDAGLYEAQVFYNKEIRSCRVELGVVTGRRRWKTLENHLDFRSHHARLMETCWFHNGHPVLTSGASCSMHGAFYIHRPTVSDSGSWHCQLRYADNEIVSATHNLQILGFDGPTNPVVYAAAGSAADLPCTLNHLPSAFGIHVVKAHWSRFAGGHLQNWSILQNQSNRSFPLHLPVVGLGDAGRYSCAVTVDNKMLRRDMTLAVITGEKKDRVAFSFAAVTPGIQGPVSEGSHLLLTCSLTHPQGHEHFQWKRLSSASADKKLTVATSHNLKDSRVQTGPTLEIPQVSQKDVGIWECSVYGPEGRLGAVEYGLQITGTVSRTSETSPFFSPCSVPLITSSLGLNPPLTDSHLIVLLS
uniref:Ig-like domain-containing protein n=1 Tax=Coturnix japonica TaxID=93934 RepID=A0A8C2YEM7_COTJA